MNYNSNVKIISELYNETIQFLINIFLNEKNNIDIISLCLWCINNFNYYNNLCLQTFFQKNLLTIFKNYINNNEILNESIFNEICIGYKYFIPCIINDDKNYIILKEYNIMSLIIEGFKKVEKIKKINIIGQNIICIIFDLLTSQNEDLNNFNRNIFEIKGGNENIFDKINLFFLEQNNINNKEKINQLIKENDLLDYIHFIQNKLLNYESD